MSTAATSQACAAAAAWRTLPPLSASICGITRGRTITAAMTRAAPNAGPSVAASEASPGSRLAASSVPKRISAPRLTPLVTRKRTAERLTANAVGMPERISYFQLVWEARYHINPIYSQAKCYTIMLLI